MKIFYNSENNINAIFLLNKKITSSNNNNNIVPEDNKKFSMIMKKKRHRCTSIDVRNTFTNSYKQNIFFFKNNNS